MRSTRNPSVVADPKVASRPVRSGDSTSRRAATPALAVARGAPVSDALLEVRRIRQMLGSSPHSRELPARLLDRLARLGRIEIRVDGDLIHGGWQPVRSLWFVLSGGLSVDLLDDDGNARIGAVLGEGSYFGAGSLMGEGEIVKSEVRAIGATHLAVFALTDLEREFAGDEVVARHKLDLLYRRLLASMDVTRDLLAASVRQRVVRRLLGQALAAGRGPEVELHVSQTDLAAMIGASRTKVNQELRRLERRGVVRLGYRKITVCNLDTLRAAAGTEVLPM